MASVGGSRSYLASSDEIGGSRSYLAGSDEVIQHACGPCKDDGETKEAKYRCESCNTYLCFDCRNDHKKLKATKNHSIVSAYQPQRTGSAVIKGTFTILCGCNQKRAVDVYCERHAEVICFSCKTIKHRNCKTCPITDKVDKHTQKQFKRLMVEAKSLKADIESCIQNGEANRKSTDNYKDECKKDISAFRIEINKILDKMEEEIIEKLDKTAKQNLLALERQIADMTASLQALNTDLDVIENANKTNEDEIIFSAKVKISKSISEYDDLIQDIRKGMKRPQLEFHKNKKLTDLLQYDVDGLGRIEPSESGISQQHHVEILDMKVKSTKKVNIELPDDNGDPSITGCTFLSKGRILLCDNENQKLKLLDSNMSVKKILKLSDYPWNVAAFGENEAIITFGSEIIYHLQYIHTHPDLELGKKITLPEKCLGLQVVNDEIYTVCHKDFGHDEIWRLDRAGNIMSKIILTQSSSNPSDYMYLGLSLAGSSPRVYLTDWNHCRVTCFQLDGKMVYQYEEKEQLGGFNGVYVDLAGNSLVCCTDSDTVAVITADGKKHGELLTSKDITRPLCIDYRPENNTLIVGGLANPKLFVYKLGK